MNKHTLNKLSTQPRQYLKEWRMVHGLTQTELAQRMGVSKSEISRLEGGNRKISISWLEGYSKALGIEREQLLTPPGVTVMKRETVMTVPNPAAEQAPARQAAPAQAGGGGVGGVGEFGLSAAAPYIFAAMPNGELLLIDSSKGQVVGKFTKV